MNFLHSTLALLSPLLKGRVTQRLARILGQLPDGTQVLSNLAINSRVSFKVPAANALYAFGAPAQDRAERGALLLAAQLCAAADAFIDVGANQGLFSCYVRTRAPRVPIVDIEADPNLAGDLLGNFLHNGLDIEVIHPAASDVVRSTHLRNHADCLT